MRIIKGILAIFPGATLCLAQAINISGVVVDSEGAGIAGATVRLLNADVASATTDAEGVFCIAGLSTGARAGVQGTAAVASPIRIQNGNLELTVMESTPVSVSVHDVGGRLLFTDRQTYGSGTHRLQAPARGAGINIYRVSVGGGVYTYARSPLGTFSQPPGLSRLGASGIQSDRQAGAAAAWADVLMVVKEGQLNYAGSIRTPICEIVVRMVPNAGNVTDADGNIYQSVRIGNQVWTVENLRTTKYNDGSAIPGPTFTSMQWAVLSTPAYCWYEDSTGTAYRQKWGALYNWHAANTGKLAPEGWRVPTDEDWTTLSTCLGGDSVAGGELKEHGTANWLSSNAEATSSTGFSALPGGFRGSDGRFHHQGYGGYWWSIKEDLASFGYLRYLSHNYSSLGRRYEEMECGFSVRLVRDN